MVPELVSLFPEGTRAATQLEYEQTSQGSVLKPETLNYRTFRPEPDGLYDEEIFGPLTYSDDPQEQVEALKGRFRRRELDPNDPLSKQFGYIWTMRMVNPLIWTRAPELIVERTGLELDTITGLVSGELVYEYDTGEFIEPGGAFGPTTSGIFALTQQLRGYPDMIIDRVHVLPVAARPLATNDKGYLSTNGINDLYRRVINRRNRLQRIIEMGAPDLVVNNEQRMMFDATCALFDNGSLRTKLTDPDQRPLPSLMDLIDFDALIEFDATASAVKHTSLQAQRALEALGFRR